MTEQFNLRDMAIAQETVDGMQEVLDKLRDTAQEYDISVPELYNALEVMGVPLETSARVYAMLKQLMITTSHVVLNEPDPQQLVSNLFSLTVGNMLFYKKVAELIPDDIASEVIIAVSSLLFQLENADVPEVDVDSELPEQELVQEAEQSIGFVPKDTTLPAPKTFTAIDDEIAGIIR